MYKLMLEDSEVLVYDFEHNSLKILKPELVPFSLRGYIKTDCIESTIESIYSLKEWLAHRILPLTRANAKQLYTILGCTQCSSISDKAKLVSEYHAVSINDCYWVMSSFDNLKWKDVDIRKKHLVNLIPVSLEGQSPTLTVDESHPDFYTDGLFPKAWIRKDDSLYLLKGDRTKDGINVKCEVWSSKILDCINGIEHVSYVETVIDNMYVSVCKILDRPEGYSICSCEELYSHCNRNKIGYKDFCIKHLGQSFINMCVVDYVIHNTDRHTGNYYFYMNNATGEIKKMTPLLDHNQALVSYILDKTDKNVLSQVYNNKQSMQSVFDECYSLSDISVNIDKLNLLRGYLPDIVIDSVIKYAVNFVYEEKTNESIKLLNNVITDTTLNF